MVQSLYELLRSCTVRLSVPKKTQGTGFFVAPGFILTCAHVVQEAQRTGIVVDAYWNDQTYPAQTKDVRATPYPDIALLQVNLTSHPCVYLSEEAKPFDRLYCYGYPDDYPNGDSATLDCEGWTDEQQPLLKLKQGQIRPGLSGAPLLNMRTQRVCGLVKRTRDRETDLGGRAIPTKIVFREFGQLVTLQQEFHQQDKRWYDCLTQQQREAGGLVAPSEGIEVFFLFADVDEDKKLVNKLERHLATMQRQSLITTWNKGKMAPGGDEKSEMSIHMNRAKVILLMVSADFMALHYLDGTEVEQAMEKRKTGTVVIPVLLRPTDYKGAPFEGITPLPRNRKPVTEWSSTDSAFYEVSLGIRQVVEGLKNANPR